MIKLSKHRHLVSNSSHKFGFVLPKETYCKADRVVWDGTESCLMCERLGERGECCGDPEPQSAQTDSALLYCK